MFFVYLLRCADNSYYCGQTDNLESRLYQHEKSEVGYTSTRKPVELVWHGEFESRDAAIAFEQQIKGWSRAKKEALIAGDWDRMKVLAKSNSAVRGESTTDRTEITIARVEFNSVRAELVEASANSSTGSERTVSGGSERFLGINPSTSSGRTVFGNSERTASGESVRMVSGGSKRTNIFESLLSANPTVQRRAMAKAITLLESTRADHRTEADALLTALLPHTGKSFRIGMSGVPGVGKSTFIEALGLHLVSLGHRVAVLAIDPSSTVSGGSILGDKTRMEYLSVHPQAFIRPSPSSGTLGGVADKTREAMLVCEAAGYDVVIVETVGVGQSEVAVASMTDAFVLMQLPNAGDDLQAIKKGVMELADVVAINKADIDPAAATRAEAQIVSSLRLLGIHHAHGKETATAAWLPRVLQLSALQGTGVAAFWDCLQQFQKVQQTNSEWTARRQKQALSWMWERIQSGLQQAFNSNAAVAAQLPQLSSAVANGSLAASTAARQLLALASAPS